MKNSGYVVEHKVSGHKGRTYHSKGLINGKVPVYFSYDVKTVRGISTPILSYVNKAVLCKPENLKTIGFID